MITISRDTWGDLHTNSASSIIREQIIEMLKKAIEAEIEVWLTEVDGIKFSQFEIKDGNLSVSQV